MGPLVQWFLCGNQIMRSPALDDVASWPDTKLKERSIGWIPAPTHSIGRYLPLYSVQPT